MDIYNYDASKNKFVPPGSGWIKIPNKSIIYISFETDEVIEYYQRMDGNYDRIENNENSYDKLWYDKNVIKKFITDFENNNIKIINNPEDSLDNDPININSYSMLELVPTSYFKLINGGFNFWKYFFYLATKIIDDVENGIFTYFTNKYFEISESINQLIFLLLFMRNDMNTLDIFLNSMEFKPGFVIESAFSFKKYLSIEQFGKIIFYQQKNIEDNYLEFTKKLFPKFRTKIIDIIEELGIKFFPYDNIFPRDYIFTKDECEYFVANKIGTDHLVEVIIGSQKNNYYMIPWLIQNDCKPISNSSIINMQIYNIIRFAGDDYSDSGDDYSECITLDIVKDIINSHREIIDSYGEKNYYFNTSDFYSVGLLCITSGKNLDEFVDILLNYRLMLGREVMYKEISTVVLIMYIWESMDKNEEIFNYLLREFTSDTEFIDFFSTYNISNYGLGDNIVKIIDKIFDSVTIDIMWDSIVDNLKINGQNNCDPFDDECFIYYIKKYLRDEHLEYFYSRCSKHYPFRYPYYIYNYVKNGYRHCKKKC